ncbi:MAG: sugar phosphate nucleotidyltransferase [Patescibacteria group bacterium]|nr:sugar phosphate nucleotidyltransferase [Patescibacteria group bacterium]
MRKLNNIIVLAGGDSDRFWPLESKVIFPFFGKPFLIDVLKKLVLFSEKVHLVINEKNLSEVTRLIDHYRLSKQVKIYLQRSHFLGQAGAVDTLKTAVSGEVLIVNACDKINFSVIAELSSTTSQSRRIALFGKKVHEYFPGGYIKFNRENQIDSVIEKPAKSKIPSNYIKLVLDYYSDFRLITQAIEKVGGKTDDIYEQAINVILADSSLEREFFVYQGEMVSLKYPWDVLSMMKSYLKEIEKPYIGKTAKVSKTAKISGNVYLEEGVVVGDYVKIVGPTYIGKNTVIADYTLIRESHIGDDALVGSYTEVARSYLGNRVFLHRNYVGDSVLADGVMVGAGANLANLRFDDQVVRSTVGNKKIETNLHKLGAVFGKNSRVGVNSTLYPGVKIGKQTWVAPGEIVSQDLPDRAFYRDRQIVDNKMI